MKDDRERLHHILEAVKRIEKYVFQGEEAFQQDELIQNWMARHLQVIGEAARALSRPFRQQHSEVPWASIIGMRHVLVHDYFGIDLDIVWRVVSADLPDLKHKLETILTSMSE